MVLLCRPQLGANSIAALRETLITRFIARLFYIRWESKADSSGKKHRASVDVLYDLFDKLDFKQIRKAMNNHIRRMRREGKIPKMLDLVIDSVIIELSVKSLKKSRFEKIGGRKIRKKYYPSTTPPPVAETPQVQWQLVPRVGSTGPVRAAAAPCGAAPN